jgi:3-hydroxyacyl-CoA dehydrogenase
VCIEAVARAENGAEGPGHLARGAVRLRRQPQGSDGEGLAAKNFDLLDEYVGEFQKASMCFKYAKVPVVAAVQGMALGGGCEFLMHCAKRVIALESYIGLVEAGVGLIPAGGGCKEFAIRAAQHAAKTGGNDPFEFLQPVFMTIAMANVSKSGAQAKELGFAQETDKIVLNAHELLYVAVREARALAEAGYYPKLSPRGVKVAGRTGIATLRNDAGQHEGRRHDLRARLPPWPRLLRSRCAAAMSRPVRWSMSSGC